MAKRMHLWVAYLGQIIWLPSDFHLPRRITNYRCLEGSSMYAVLLLPNFELQCALRAEPGLASTPVALIGETIGTGAPRVTQVNAAAESISVVTDMSLPQAQARCQKLVFRHCNEAQEAVIKAILLQAAERVSPYLEYTAPGCCSIFSGMANWIMPCGRRI